MIFDSNAVVDPLAMMIKALHTLVACVAVSRVGRHDDLTVGAQRVMLEFLYKSYKWNRSLTSHVAWVRSPCQKEKDHGSREYQEQDREPAVCFDV